MYKKSVFAFLFAAILMYGCGYKMVITGRSASFKVYPAVVENRSNDIQITPMFRDEIKVNLSSINALAAEKDAEYTGEFILTELKSTGSSTTSSTTTANEILRLHITIKDKEGNTVMNRVFTEVENYDNTPSISETRTNKEDAIRKAINKAITDFRNVFEKK